MFLVFLSSDCVICYFFHESLFVLSSAYYILYFHHLQYWSYLLSIALLTFFHPIQHWSSLVSYPWIPPSMLKTSGPALRSAFSRTCNRLERSLAWKIVSNTLWKHAELTDEAVDQFRMLKTAMEILAAALNADYACLESILDDVAALTRTIKDSCSDANDDHLMSILDSAATFMEAIENSTATASNSSLISGFGSATILAIPCCRIGSWGHK